MVAHRQRLLYDAHGSGDMDVTLTLSQQQIQDYLECPRRFQLRHLDYLSWPDLPYPPDVEAAFSRGRLLHRLIERYFLGLPVSREEIVDPVVAAWWDTFMAFGPKPDTGRILPEASLTVPVGNHQLRGRFDLVHLDTLQTPLVATVYDWKTSKPRDLPWLRKAWQTRLYLALMAEGGGALPGAQGQLLDPDLISLVYWYLDDPEQPVRVEYSRDWHAENWQTLQRTVDAIDASLRANEWPKTDDWSACRYCAFQVYCGRQDTGRADLTDAGEDDIDSLEQVPSDLAPDWL